MGTPTASQHNIFDSGKTPFKFSFFLNVLLTGFGLGSWNDVRIKLLVHGPWQCLPFGQAVVVVNLVYFNVGLTEVVPTVGGEGGEGALLI